MLSEMRWGHNILIKGLVISRFYHLSNITQFFPIFYFDSLSGSIRSHDIKMLMISQGFCETLVNIL